MLRLSPCLPRCGDPKSFRAIAAPAELLDFRLMINGEAPFLPVRIFADGSRTYFDLHPPEPRPQPGFQPR